MAVNPTTGVPEFDDPSSLNMEALTDAIDNCKKSGNHDFLIVEGSMVFTNLYVVSSCDISFFIELNCEQVSARRSLRKYDIPDPPQFIEKYVWPKHVKHLAEYEEMKKGQDWSVVLLDGSFKKHEIVDFVAVLMEQNQDHYENEESSEDIDLSIGDDVTDVRPQSCNTRCKV